MSFLHRLFKFRIFKFRTNLAEELEDCHLESINIKESLTQTRLLQRKLTRSFAIYAVLIYLILNAIYFILFLPHDNMIRLYAVLTSLGIGAILFGIHWLLRWYFRTAIRTKEDRLTLFRERKQELIEEVKKKETYAKAKTLLEKYGETMEPQSEAATTVTHAKTNTRQSGSDKPMISISPTNAGKLQTTTTQVPVTITQNRPSMNGLPGKLPRAILPPQRTFWGAVLDAIVGDGPSKRYALICRQCSCHNGMALEEEFEYISYRCAYCNYYNNARKQKPVFSGKIAAHDPQSVPSQAQVQNETTTEQMEISSSDSAHSNDVNNETDIRHRTVNVVKSESRSRSPSAEHRSALLSSSSSSSNENLTKED